MLTTTRQSVTLFPVSNRIQIQNPDLLTEIEIELNDKIITTDIVVGGWAHVENGSIEIEKVGWWSPEDSIHTSKIQEVYEANLEEYTARLADIAQGH